MFEKAIVIGRGKTAMACAQSVAQTGVPVEFYTIGEDLQSVSRKLQSSENAAVSNRVVKKTELKDLLLKEQAGTLLVSAANPWLIPESILEKGNITAVNFHNALLPRHPGRNAEAWAIYGQDRESGITWHYINTQVDAGDIIVQKTIQITDSMTAFRLLHEQNNIAVEAFKEVLPSLMDGTCKGYPQSGPRGKLHYSWERPNDGILDLNWHGDKISAFLRAMDYGVLKLMDEPSIHWQGYHYIWKKYTISFDSDADEGIKRDSGGFTIIKNGMKIKLTGFERKGDNAQD